MKASRLAAILVISSSCILGQTTGSPTQTVAPPPDTQAGSQKAKSEPKIIVMYKSGASEEDKSRVHATLHAGITMKLGDSAEEVTIAVPTDQDGKKYVQHVLADANKDPAVFKAYKSQSYALQ